MAADLVVFDPDTIARRDAGSGATTCPPAPAGSIQRAAASPPPWSTARSLLRDGKHTGALPGQLLRGPLARR